MPKVTAEQVGKRTDIAASELFEESRSTIKNWINAGRLLHNNAPAKASQKVALNDTFDVTVKVPEILDLEPIDLALEIIYEDADIAVINKPAGLTVHPAATTKEATLVHGLLHQIKDLQAFDDTIRPGIVHRLDKDTSGAMVVAKHKAALLTLQTALKARTVKRTYIALVKGHLAHAKGTIDAPIGRHPVKRQSMAVTPGGKPSITHFNVLNYLDESTYIQCDLESGRTHQIRVHMAHIGHPVLGDPKYGVPLNQGCGQFLHAQTLSLVHPTSGETMTFDTPMPDDFKTLLDTLTVTN